MTPDRLDVRNSDAGHDEPVAEPHAAPEPVPPVESGPSARARPTLVDAMRKHGAQGLLYTLAAVPIVSMVVEISRAPKLQFYDYWFVLARVANPDGSLNPRGIFTYRNEHPTFLPGLIYWLDARLLGGDNRPLGVLSLLMAVATVVLLVYLLPRSVSGVKRAALAMVFAFLLFTPHGLHNYVMGMSGTGWLLANLSAAAALLAVQRDRGFTAIGFALIGSLSYGTAFALWPAIAAAHWLRGDRWWRAALPIGIGLTIIAVWALTLDGLNPGPETTHTGLEATVAGLAGTAGALWGGLAPIAGMATIVVLVVLGALTARQRLTQTAPDGPADRPEPPRLTDSAAWVGLAVYALGSVAMIALARNEEGFEALLTSRYASIPALALCALLGLGAIVVTRIRVSVAVPLLLGVALATYGLGATRAATVRDNFPKQSAVAVAMRVGAVHAILDDTFPDVAVESTHRIGAYPFTGDFSLGCDGPELGDRVDLGSATALLPAPGLDGYAGTVDLARNELDKAGNAKGWYFSGWALVAGRRADCVLIADSAGTVVGGGAVEVRRRDVVSELVVDEAHSGFIAVAAPGATDPVVLVRSEGLLYRVQGPNAP